MDLIQQRFTACHNALGNVWGLEDVGEQDAQNLYMLSYILPFICFQWFLYLISFLQNHHVSYYFYDLKK